jgi:hypothetical protein
MGVARAILLCLALAVLGGCQYARNLNGQAYRQYHESRWNEAVRACVDERGYAPPSTPATPRIAYSRGLETLYGLIPLRYGLEREKFGTLVRRSEVSTQFVAEMLSVLNNRDTTNIESLSRQIDEYFGRQQEAREAWRTKFAELDVALADLEAAWDEVWPDNDFSFELDQELTQVWLETVPELTNVRRTALERYYGNEFNRQAMIYLDYEPVDFDVLPESHVPAGCDDLSAALNRQEAGLLVRYSLDQAIASDVELVQRLALVDLSRTPWEDVKVPKGRYAEPRVAAAIARLKLLKYIDELLSSSLDVFLYDVQGEWNRVWPGNQLDTNIFSFAGLPRAEWLGLGESAGAAPDAN